MTTFPADAPELSVYLSDEKGEYDMKKLICIILLMVLPLCGCSINNDKTEEGADSTATRIADGEIRLGCVPIDTLNPLVSVHASVCDFLSLVYEGLFEVMPDHSAVPVLASEYIASENNTVYTIKLKSGIKFHGSQPFGSDDVAATLDYIKMYGGKYSSLMSNVLSYETPSDETIVIKLINPVADFVNLLDFPILPSGLLPEAFLPATSSFVPNGTGMYCFDSKQDYKNIYLKINKNWHETENTPLIKRVNIEILSDEETVISAFDAGAIDVLTTSWKPASEMNLTSSEYNIFETEQNRYTFVGINPGSAALDTVSERRALMDAVDSPTITQDIMLGGAVEAKFPLREGIYFNEKTKSDDEAVSKNKNDSLPKSGKKDEEASADNKQKEKKEPENPLYLLYNSESKTKERLAVALKHQLESKGYPVVLDPQEYSSYLLKVSGCAYDLYIGEVGIDNSGNLEFMFGQNRTMQNICIFSSPELATLISNLNRMTDKESRAVAWENFEKYYADNAFQIPLYFTNGSLMVAKRIKGSAEPNLSSLLAGFENLYVEK